MEHAVRQFARRLLLVHLARLALVLGVVAFAARSIEQGAREQALRNAQRRQELLANQEARGVESCDRNILDDMNLPPRGGDKPGDRSVVDTLLVRAQSTET